MGQSQGTERSSPAGGHSSWMSLTHAPVAWSMPRSFWFINWPLGSASNACGGHLKYGVPCLCDQKLRKGLPWVSPNSGPTEGSSRPRTHSQGEPWRRNADTFASSSLALQSQCCVLWFPCCLLTQQFSGSVLGAPGDAKSTRTESYSCFLLYSQIVKFGL